MSVKEIELEQLMSQEMDCEKKVSWKKSEKPVKR